MWQTFTFLNVSVAIAVIWGCEPSRQHLENERGSPKVNVWNALTQERVIGRFFFDDDIITRNSFLDMLENYAPPQLNNNNNSIL
jgi:hypothetical protein